MRRSLVLAFLILLTAGVMAMGAPLDDAKRSAAAIDKKLAASGGELQGIAKSFAQHLAALADIARQLEQQRDRQKQAAPLIAKALESVNADLIAAKADASGAERASRTADAAAAHARADLGPKRAAIERAASAERKAFESSDAYTEASAKVEATAAAVASERARLDAVLKNDPKIARLLAALAKSDADLASARAAAPAEDAALAEASARWLDAKNALTAAQTEAYAKDSAFVSTEKAAGDAMAARTALSDAFDRSILGQPGVAEAQLTFRDATNAVKLADADAARAREDVARAGRWLIARRASADAISGIAREADEGLAAAAADVARARDATRAIADDVSKAAAHVLAIRDDAKAVADAIATSGKK